MKVVLQGHHFEILIHKHLVTFVLNFKFWISNYEAITHDITVPFINVAENYFLCCLIQNLLFHESFRYFSYPSLNVKVKLKRNWNLSQLKDSWKALSSFLLFSSVIFNFTYSIVFLCVFTLFFKRVHNHYFFCVCLLYFSFRVNRSLI